MPPPIRFGRTALCAALPLFAAPLFAALSLRYPATPILITDTVAVSPSVEGLGAGASASFALAAGILPSGLTLDPASGTISGTPTASGTFRPTLTIASGGETAVAHPIFVVVPPAAGLNADRPVLFHERGGALDYPWGGAYYAWPPQLFWQNVDQISSPHLNEMRAAAAGIEAAGMPPVLNCVAWGYEYAAATGSGIPDNSAEGGWREWGRWMSDPAHARYRSTNWYGIDEPGYVTPLMPMEPADWPAEWTPPDGWVAPADWVGGRPARATSYAEWLGVRLAQLAWYIGARGMFCADYVVGLEWGDAIDYNDRVVADFAAWSGVEISGATIAERADFIQENHKSLWWDFKCTRFRDFYASMGRNLLANGKVPLVGGQILPLPMMVRGSGNDFRICTQGPGSLPGRYWFFNIEVQGDSLRLPQDYWQSSIGFGATACREPDMQFGAHLDARGGQGEFDRSVSNANHDEQWGIDHVAQQWLSVGWAHIAGRDGAVRRATMSLMRSYWDAGLTPETELRLLLGHTPRRPFGPAFYYSAAIERSFEVGNGKTGNNMWWCLHKYVRELSPTSFSRGGHARGLSTGYFVSDVALDRLQPADYPSAWIVYDSERLPAAERAKLEAIAPIFDIDAENGDGDGAKAAALLARGPVRVEQAADQCLNCLAFVDQNGSVIVMVSNTLETAGSGTLRFNDVTDGTFDCHGLLGAPDSTLEVSGNGGSLSVAVPARGTIVLEIPGLKWLGRGGTTYAEWAADNFSAAERAVPERIAPEADPDGTGVPNLLRYACRLPARGAVPPVLRLHTTDEVGQAALSVAFDRNPAARDVRYSLETSADLNTWVEFGTADPGIPGELRIAVPAESATGPRRFYRLRVSQTEAD
jgi:hypothetical protein